MRAAARAHKASKQQHCARIRSYSDSARRAVAGTARCLSWAYKGHRGTLCGLRSDRVDDCLIENKSGHKYGTGGLKYWMEGHKRGKMVRGLHFATLVYRHISYTYLLI